MGPLFFLLLPALASCNITTVIVLNTDIIGLWVTTFGSYSNIINGAEEKIAFPFKDKHLQEAVKGNISRVSEVYLGSPISDPSLFKDRHWSEVKHILEPKENKISSFKTDQQVITVRRYDASEIKKVHLSSIWSVLEDSLETDWTVPSAIKENIAIAVLGAANTNTTITYGRNEKKKKRVIVKADPFFHVPSVDLIPGHDAIATVTTTRVSLDILSAYSESLVGDVVCAYPLPSTKMYYYEKCYDIADVMKLLGLSSSLRSMLTLKLKFHTHGKITLTDSVTNKTLAEVGAKLRVM